MSTDILLKKHQNLSGVFSVQNSSGDAVGKEFCLRAESKDGAYFFQQKKVRVGVESRFL